MIEDYELIHPPFGKGGFGEVWLARSAVPQWQAIKIVYASNFGEDPYPYEAEFKGVQRYKPVSEQHLGLLRVEKVSTKRPDGYFYYVMELGDSRNPGWEEDPTQYKPKRRLNTSRKSAPDRRMPVNDCLPSFASALQQKHLISCIKKALPIATSNLPM